MCSSLAVFCPPSIQPPDHTCYHKAPGLQKPIHCGGSLLWHTLIAKAGSGVHESGYHALRGCQTQNSCLTLLSSWWLFSRFSWKVERKQLFHSELLATAPSANEGGIMLWCWGGRTCHNSEVIDITEVLSPSILHLPQTLLLLGWKGSLPPIATKFLTWSHFFV